MKDSAPSPRRLQYLRDYRRRKRSIRLWQVCLLAGLFALWELTTRLGLSDGFLTSSPSRMAGTLQSLWHSGDLWRHIGTSCLETVVGFTAGTLLGTAIAVAMLLAFHILLFSGVQFGIAVMRMAQGRDSGPRGLRRPLGAPLPIMIPARKNT